MNLRKFQKAHYQWVQHNFPNRKHHQPLLGTTEECAELIDAMLSSTAMLNVMSMIGALSHSHLKMEQGIRGTPADHQAAKEDAVGDILIYLTDYCSLNGIDMEKALETSWSEVSKRDWIKFPKNGVSE
jgi:NTP pyrophosphatase (non-canonical NTP hydrolase)